EVSELATRRGVALGRLLIPHAQAAFGLLGTDGVDADAGAIVKWIKAHGLEEFSRRDCQTAMEGRFRNLERLTKALQRLEQQDVLRHYTKRNKGAPPTEACIVNLKLLSY